MKLKGKLWGEWYDVNEESEEEVEGDEEDTDGEGEVKEMERMKMIMMKMKRVKGLRKRMIRGKKIKRKIKII